MTENQNLIIEKWKKIYKLHRIPNIIFEKCPKIKGIEHDGVWIQDRNLIQISSKFKNDIRGFEETIAHELFHCKNHKFEDDMSILFDKKHLQKCFWWAYEEFIDRFVSNVLQKENKR